MRQPKKGTSEITRAYKDYYHMMKRQGRAMSAERFKDYMYGNYPHWLI